MIPFSTAGTEGTTVHTTSTLKSESMNIWV
nr:MAG TPA: hypothetical protein [Caudoviricetes sp.]